MHHLVDCLISIEIRLITNFIFTSLFHFDLDGSFEQMSKYAQHHRAGAEKHN